MTLKNERAQSAVLTIVFLTVLMGMATLVLDVGSWYRAHRSAQSTADAAALAASQALPQSTQEATMLAQSYATKNGGGIAPGGITFSAKYMANDSVTVRIRREAPGFFAKLFRLNSVTVGAKATARAYNLAAPKYVAPIVVHYKHPMLNCRGGGGNITCDPIFDRQTTLNLEDLHQPGGGSGAGAFGLINLNTGDKDGNIGAGTLADWLIHGYDQEMPLGRYYSAPSANFNNSQFRAALDAVIGKEVLFPVYRLLTGPGANAQYDIIGWVGFVIESYAVQGSDGTLTGHFTHYIAHGLPAPPRGGAGGLGAQTIELVE